jgi:hypothetical protein
VKPFRGKRRGPQRRSVGFSPRAGRCRRRRIRQRSVPAVLDGRRSGALPADRAPRPVGRRSEVSGRGDETPVVSSVQARKTLARRPTEEDTRSAVRRVVVVSCVRHDRRGLSSVPVDSGRSAMAAIPADSGSVANRSVTCPTRLETRTKESNMCASRRALRNPAGAVKAKAGPRDRLG